jgi:glycosyltransferase involved in cell wall biosynthesis
LPVVSTRTGAIPEYLDDGVNGLLVDPGDARALAAALRRLLLDPPLRARLGAAARESSAAYDWSAVSRRIGELYRRVTPAEGTSSSR